MTHARGFFAAAASCLLAARAWAQPQPPEPIEAPAPHGDPATEEPEPEGEPDRPPPPPAPPPPETREPVDDGAAAEPPLPPPTLDEQSPRPFLRDPSDDARWRAAEVGADIGVVIRPADEPSPTYSPGPAFGAHVRVEALRWLAFRARYLYATHAVSTESGTFPPATRRESDALGVHQLGIRIEPTWPIAERARLWLSAGIAWSRIEAPRLELTAESAAGTMASLEPRGGVALEYPLGLGAGWEVVPEWLVLTLEAEAAPLTSQSGDVFDTRLTVDQNGQLVRVGGMPRFSFTFGALAGIAIVF